MTPGDVYSQFAASGAPAQGSPRADATRQVSFDEATTKPGAKAAEHPVGTGTSQAADAAPPQVAFTGVVKERKPSAPPKEQRIQQGFNSQELQHDMAKLSIRMASTANRLERQQEQQQQQQQGGAGAGSGSGGAGAAATATPDTSKMSLFQKRRLGLI